MIDWDLAVRIASRFAGTYPLEGTYHSDLLAREAPGIIAEAAQMVEAETRLASVGVPEVAVVTRKQWAESNVAVFSKLLAPAEAAIKKQNPLASRVVAAEMGAMLGFLARKVLGQYELVLPGDDTNGDVVYLVGANVLSMERSNQFRPHEFRLWIALHECAHRLQFVGVPWLREYFLELVGERVASAIPEPGRWARVMQMSDEPTRTVSRSSEKPASSVCSQPRRRRTCWSECRRSCRCWRGTGTLSWTASAVVSSARSSEWRRCSSNVARILVPLLFSASAVSR